MKDVKTNSRQRGEFSPTALLGGAIKELESVLGGKDSQAQTRQSVQGSEEMNGIKHREETKVEMKKGANQKGKRKALGRGLSALMTSNSLEVPVSQEGRSQAVEAPRVEPDFDKATKAAIFGARAESRPRVLEGNKQNEETDTKQRKLSPILSKPLPPKEREQRLQVPENVEGLLEIELSSLVANPKQPRQFFSDEEIDELARSLRQSGVLQPILVRKHSEQEDKFEIIAGERRVRAAKKAGLSKVPALLRELDDREVLEISIVENVQRSQLNSVEEARAYARLQAEFGLSQEEVARTVGKDRATVANSLRLLKLSDKVLDMLMAEQLTAGHARALLMLDSKAQQEKAALKIVEKLLSVRAAEQLVRDSKSAGSNSKTKATKVGAKSKSEAAPIQRQALEERFRRALGTKVALRLNSKGAGELKINFYSQEELDKLIELLDA